MYTTQQVSEAAAKAAELAAYADAEAAEAACVAAKAAELDLFCRFHDAYAVSAVVAK